MLPDGLSKVSAENPAIELPLFVIILGSVLLGLIIGFIWEFVIEQTKKSDLRRKVAEVEKLRGEITRLKAEKHEGKDKVLALLEEAS